MGYITQNSSASDRLVNNCTFSGTIEVTESKGDTSVGGILGSMLRWSSRDVAIQRCSDTGDLTAQRRIGPA